jgi:hypothetical protein
MARLIGRKKASNPPARGWLFVALSPMIGLCPYPKGAACAPREPGGRIQ